MSYRFRFSPSPTGPLHIGGLRTAWYNWILAQQHQDAAFILRIEDTDQKRCVAGSQAHIEASLAWIGIQPDEGPSQGGPFAPYRQSEREALYHNYALQLIEQGSAYYAFDTPAALEALRERKRRTGIQAPKYDAITRMSMNNSLTLAPREVERRLQAGAPYVIRLRVDPQAKVRFQDEIRGWIQMEGRTLDDKILLKEDGMPTYHLASVVDDHLMQITHVVRGEEWLPSAPIHLQLYQALGWTPPRFAHLPLLLRSDGQGKLSKRTARQDGLLIFPIAWEDPATGEPIQGFREAGYLPEAMGNFLTLLGWHPSGQEEKIDFEQTCVAFSLRRVHKGGARCDLGKFRWLNQQYLRALPESLLIQRYLAPKLAALQQVIDPAYLQRACQLIKEHVTFPRELWEKHSYCFIPPTTYPWEAIRKRWHKSVPTLLQATATALAQLDPFTLPSLSATIAQEAHKHAYPKGHLMALIRYATTGRATGPELGPILLLLGQESLVHRLNTACTDWPKQMT